MKRLHNELATSPGNRGSSAGLSGKKGGTLIGVLTLLILSVAPAQAVMVTVTGRLTEDADDKAFFMKDTAGTAYKVDTRGFAGAAGTDKLLGGNTVRVHGDLVNGVIYAGNVRFLGDRFVKKGTRLSTSGYRATTGAKATLVGVLANDADDYAFEIRDNKGRGHKIFGPTIPESTGINKLMKGQLVRVHGRWAADKNGWAYLDATNFRVLRSTQFR